MRFMAKYIQWAPFAETDPEPKDKLPNYQEAVSLGALNQVTESPSYNEAKGYGDDALKVYVNKFQQAVLGVQITEIPREQMSAVSGAQLEAGKNKNMRFRSSDTPPKGGLGFIYCNVLDDGGGEKRVGVFYPKVKAMLQDTTYNTNGENISLAYDKLQFTASACNSGDWKIESPDFDTDEEAMAWVDGMFDGTSTDIGKEDAGGQPEAQSTPARSAGKAAVQV